MSQSILSGVIFKIQTFIWFFLALVMFVLLLSVWLMSDPTHSKTKQQKEVASGPAPLPVYIESYVQMTKEVPPIDFSTVVRDLRHYPDEFKGKKDFEKHAKNKKWTVQVMNVSNNELIVEYLKQRNDRHKFAYFRYHNTNGELRYILTYDTMNSAQDALTTIKNVDFGLPSSVKLKAEEISYYVKIMDDYERGGIYDFHSDSGSSVIELESTDRPLGFAPMKPSTPKTPTPNAGGVDNKYQNATPATPVAPVVGGAVPTANANVNAQANANTPSPQASAPQAPKSASTAPKPTPKPAPAQESMEVTQEISLDNRPKAPPVPTPPPAPPTKLVSPEAVPAPPPPSQGEVYYGRPNTNTNSIPGADRD